MLPSDLRQAEAQALQALDSALSSDGRQRWTADLRFEGLKLLPLALRLAERLVERSPALKVVFPDAGATALARRDGGALAPLITSLGDQRRQSSAAAREGAAERLLLVGPGPSDYDLVEAVCEAHPGPVVLLNPTLEDAAVGIGSVARARRKGFLAQWQPAYALQPFADSALRRAHPGEWELFRLDPDGFRLAARFPQKPTAEEQAAALSGEGGGLGQQLRSLGELIDNLQR
ncbi:MAG: DUF1995 family protein [Cyanobacteriota bacterium]|nr:DUF1995 family protein [Cyanobacteriota bacterium]